MQRKHLFVFVAVAVLFGAIISMATSGVFVSAQTNDNDNNDNNNNKNNTNSSTTIDSDFVKEGLIDDDEKGTGEDPGTDDIAGEQDDNEDCTEDDTLEAGTSTAAASESKEGAEDADEPGDNDVNDEEDEDTGAEDAGELDDETENVSSTTTTTSAGNISATIGAEEQDESEEDDDDQAAFEPCSFSNEIDNPYLPLSTHIGKTLKFEGTSTAEDGSSVKVEEFWNVRSETVDIADVETLVVVVQEYEDGELVQEAIQYYAQGIDGTVYNFGEEVADYENGVAVENDDESWTVGDDTATPGIAMPANPATGIGFAYQSVNVPGLAHELSEVTSLSESVNVEHGFFTNVLAVNDYDFDAGKTSQEFYAPEVGLIKEVDDDEELELISIE